MRYMYIPVLLKGLEMKIKYCKLGEVKLTKYVGKLELDCDQTFFLKR
jgi:hypothetical protein